MNVISHFTSPLDVAEHAAETSIKILNTAIECHGTAAWVLAGGSSPLLAYEIIAAKYANVVDWSKVSLIIGDERMVPFGNPDSNWGVLFQRSPHTHSLHK